MYDFQEGLTRLRQKSFLLTKDLPQASRTDEEEWSRPYLPLRVNASVWEPEGPDPLSFENNWTVFSLDEGSWNPLPEEWRGIVSLEDQEMMESLVQDAVRSGSDIHTEILVDQGNIQRLWKVRGRPVRDPEGESVRFIGTILDITDRRRMEEELQNAAEQRRLALESAELGAWEYHFGEGKVFWDERCREIFAVSGEDMVEYREYLQCVHPEDRPSLDERIAEALACTDGGAFRQEFRVICADGSVRWVASHGRVYGTAGETAAQAPRFIGVNMDITARVRAAEALRVGEARYRGLFSSLQEGVSLHEIIFDVKGIDYRFLDVNAAFEKLARLPRWKLIGKTFRQVFPDLDDESLYALGQVAITGEPTSLEHFSTHLGCSLELHVYRSVNGQLAVLYTDVTEKKKLQEEREKRARVEALGVLAGGIAHDFNNILTAVIGNLSLAKMHLGDDHPAAARLADSEKAMLKATTLTRQLLTFARGGEPLRKTVSPELLVAEAAQLMLHGSNCKAHLDLTDELWPVDVDAGQIHQALSNLIINALQAMPEGGNITLGAANETVEGRDPRAIAPGRYVRISVSDTGCGIPPEIMGKIFDPYFTTKPTGSGLGLSSAFSVVKRHEGAITVASVPGEGTTFDVFLPASDTVGEAAAEAPLPALNTAGGKSIILMDDEEMIRSMAADMLKELGYAVVPCCNGREAVELYGARLQEGGTFDAVILDLTVPGEMGGMEAAQLIRELDEEAVLLLSSGYSADLKVSSDIPGAAPRMFAKPYNLQMLAEELASLLGRR